MGARGLLQRGGLGLTVMAAILLPLSLKDGETPLSGFCTMFSGRQVQSAYMAQGLYKPLPKPRRRVGQRLEPREED